MKIGHFIATCDSLSSTVKHFIPYNEMKLYISYSVNPFAVSRLGMQ